MYHLDKQRLTRPGMKADLASGVNSPQVLLVHTAKTEGFDERKWAYSLKYVPRMCVSVGVFVSYLHPQAEPTGLDQNTQLIQSLYCAEARFTSTQGRGCGRGRSERQMRCLSLN